MSRPVGVTASAIVAILGSLFALFLAVLVVISPFVETTQPQPPNSAPLVMTTAAMFLVFAGIGSWTSVGLFRLRPWARMSILIFAGFLAATFTFSLLVITVMPMPPGTSSDSENLVRGSMAVTFGIPLAIAIWWLIQFNTRSTKAAFASPIAEAASGRPISITIIAWMSLLGAAFLLFPILTRMPAFLFGATFTGWAADFIYFLFAVISLYIGKGLLDLRERARVFAIGWFGFSLVHMSIVMLVPPLRERMLELQRGLEQNQPNPIPFDQGTFTAVVLGFTGLVIAATIWLLVRNRAAFVQAENP